MDGDFKGDFTRDTFNPLDPLKHFSRVLMQQGRVQLDADWNEQADILLYYLRTLAAHIIGHHGGSDNGFMITNSHKRESNFEIQPGTYYVDGILVENGGDKDQKYTTYRSQPFHPQLEDLDLDDPDKLPVLVYLDVWEQHVTCLQEGSIREVALGVNEPDTATRAQVVWQVKIMHKKEFGKIQHKGSDIDFIKIAEFYQLKQEERDDLLKEITNHLNDLSQLTNYGKLKARTWVGTADSTDACITPPNARYRGNENRLYRVEIHKGGSAWSKENKENGATFKWSRENGSVVFPIVEADGKEVTLENLGRDKKIILEKGDWVEVVDDDYVLKVSGVTTDQNAIHPLLRVTDVKVADVDQMYMRVTLSDTPAIKVVPNSKKHPVLRRWDQRETKKTKAGEGVELIEGAIKIVENVDHDDNVEYWLPLDDGIYIQFQNGGNYRSGDYWLIPARVITGDVEWPEIDGKYTPLPPRGVNHHYAPLAIITSVDQPIDLRYIIKPAVERAK